MTRPLPDPAFHWTSEVWGEALRCRPLSALTQHVFTSKQLALPNPEAWSSALASVGVTTDQLMRVKQVHGSVVRILKKGEVPDNAAGLRPDGDAVISNVKGQALAVMVADCVPILVCDPVRGAAAAIHAGWRGTCARITSTTIDAMHREFGSNAADLVAAIGPSVGPDDYEVGDTLITAFTEAGHSPLEIDRWFIRTGSKPHLDLWSANADQLVQAGIPARAVSLCRLSTVSHPEVFNSYRIDGERAGRMAGIIVVPAPA